MDPWKAKLFLDRLDDRIVPDATPIAPVPGTGNNAYVVLSVPGVSSGFLSTPGTGNNSYTPGSGAGSSSGFLSAPGTGNNSYTGSGSGYGSGGYTSGAVIATYDFGSGSGLSNNAYGNGTTTYVNLIPPREPIGGGLPDYGTVNPTRQKPANVPPTPQVPNVDGDGVALRARPRSPEEEAQVKRLMELITKNNVEIVKVEKNIFDAELNRIFLNTNAIDNRILLKSNAKYQNWQKDVLYKLQRKNVEMQNAIQCIKQNADNAYPADSVLAPDGVFDQEKIGTPQGTFVGIDAVLQEKVLPAQP